MDLPIAAPPWSGLGKRLESMVRKAIFEHEMLKGTAPDGSATEVTKVGIALSGGKDSLGLLYLLKAISGRGFPELELHAVHVTGAFSCGAGINVDFLKGICDKLNINFLLRESHQKLETLECYSCSRDRRRLLFDACKSVGVHTIAFGHHRDDSIQTLLMNLLHKAEFAANLPKIHMHDYGITIIRPLIYASEEELRTMAQQYGYARVMCRCPVGQDSMRKKVENLLVDIEQMFPNARQNLAQAGLVYGSDKAKKK